jgi:hypothetical protein
MGASVFLSSSKLSESLALKLKKVFKIFMLSNLEQKKYRKINKMRISYLKDFVVDLQQASRLN